MINLGKSYENLRTNFEDIFDMLTKIIRKFSHIFGTFLENYTEMLASF